jgi:hypothetical protein
MFLKKKKKTHHEDSAGVGDKLHGDGEPLALLSAEPYASACAHQGVHDVYQVDLHRRGRLVDAMDKLMRERPQSIHKSFDYLQASQSPEL